MHEEVSLVLRSLQLTKQIIHSTIVVHRVRYDSQIGSSISTELLFPTIPLVDLLPTMVHHLSVHLWKSTVLAMSQYDMIGTISDDTNEILRNDDTIVHSMMHGRSSSNTIKGFKEIHHLDLLNKFLTQE